MSLQPPPLSTFFTRLQRVIKKQGITGAEFQRAYYRLAYAPKFEVKDPDSILPPLEQTKQTTSPPFPFPNFLFTFTALLEGSYMEAPLAVRIVISVIEEMEENTPGITINIVGEQDTLSIPILVTRGPTLGDWVYKPIDVGDPTYVVNFAMNDLLPFFIRFLALTAAENIEVVPPSPSSLTYKREQARLKAGKKVNTYSLYHLRIPQTRKQSSSTPTGRHNRAHWRRAHLRHYVAGRGHIKTTKTVAIPPIFCGGEGFADKDYIL